MGHETLENSGLDEQRIEIAALGVLGLLEHFFVFVGIVVQAGGADRVDIIAELGQQRAVDVPAVLGGGVLQAGNGVDAHAVKAVGAGAFPDALGDGGKQLGRVSREHVVELDPVAVAGILVVLVGRPVAGEVDVDVVAAGQSRDGAGVEIAPGAPDRIECDADLLIEVRVQLGHDLFGSLRGHVAAVEPDLDGDRLCRVRSIGRCLLGRFGVGGVSGGRFVGLGRGFLRRARGEAKHHDEGQKKRKDFFHLMIPPFKIFSLYTKTAITLIQPLTEPIVRPATM